MATKVDGVMTRREFWASLDDNTIYTPGLISDHAVKTGYLKASGIEVLRQQKLRFRIALMRQAKLHHFPEDGHGSVQLNGQAPIPGWLGSYWKAVFLPKEECS